MSRNLRNISILLVLFITHMVGNAQNRDFSVLLNGSGYLSPQNFEFESNITTVEYWAFKADWTNSNDEVMLSFHENGGWEFRVRNENIQLAIYLDGVEKTISFPVSAITAGWHHFAFTFDGNYVRFYIDGYQRGYLFDFRSVITTPASNTWLCIGADAIVNGAASQRFTGMIDELRIWNKALSVIDLRDWIHRRITADSKPVFVDKLALYYAFDSANFYADASAVFNDSMAKDIISYESVQDTISTAPIQHFVDTFFNVRALWSAFAQGTFSEPSGGMNLGIKDYNEYDLYESDLFGHNGETGIITDGTTDGVDLQAKRLWFIKSNHNDELPTLRFQLFEAGAGALFYDCIPSYNYKLMYKSVLSDTFRIIEECDEVEGNLIFFRDIILETGYYTIARDNDIPTVNSNMEITNITTNSASFGGTVGCDGGGVVTAYGVCWNTSGSATIYDSLTVDGNGTGDFTSNMTNLESGITYYVRTYATNSEGTAYGEELAFETSKMYQSVTFPTLSSKPYGTADFNPGAYSTSGLPITYTSSKTAVAEILNGKIHINGVGTTTIWAYQAGNANYSPSSYKKGTLVVTKALLIFTAQNFMLQYGSVIPELSYAITGFASGENTDLIDELPVISTYATDSSTVGKYAINVSGGSDSNYEFQLVNGEIEIVKSEPIISEWPATSPILMGEALYFSQLSGGKGCVNGQFMFVDSTYIPLYNGEEVDIVFIPCDSVNFTLVSHKVAVMVDVITSCKSLTKGHFKAFPNPCNTILTIDNYQISKPIRIYDLSGVLLKTMYVTDGKIDVRSLNSGMYLLDNNGSSLIFSKK